MTDHEADHETDVEHEVDVEPGAGEPAAVDDVPDDGPATDRTEPAPTTARSVSANLPANDVGSSLVLYSLRPGTAADTDLANSERLINVHGSDLRFVDALGGWHVWDGLRWRGDNAAAVCRAKDTLRLLYSDATTTTEGLKRALAAADEAQRGYPSPPLKQAQALAAFAKRSQSARGIEAMLKLASSEVQADPSEFDSDPWLLNCGNGVLDLRTGQLREHRRADMIRSLAPVVYAAGARSPIWDRFIDDVTQGDQEMITFLRRVVGYTLTGDTREEVLLFVQGPPASGKSTFLEAIKNVLGDYAAKADFETFIARRDSGGPRNDIARLAGKRMALSIEVDEGKRLAEALIKQVTGGDTVTARYLYREAFEFKPAFKLWLAANDAPHVRDDDAAMWRRVLRIPFLHSIPAERRDPKIKAALLDPTVSGPAILSWAVEGCLEWQTSGLGVPASVIKATGEYREDCNPLRDFIKDRCVIEPQAWTPKAALRGAYEQWCKENGLRYPIVPRQFADRVKALGARETTKRIHGFPSPQHVWIGIGVRDTYGAAGEEPDDGGAV